MQIKNVMRTAAAAAAVLFATGAASAAPVTLTFEGLSDLAAVGNFYAGGGGASVDFGIVFGANAIAVIDTDSGGSGNFANEPSSSTALLLLETGLPGPLTTVMNIALGYSGAFSFSYSTVTAAGIVRIFDGLDGGGRQLDVIALNALGEGNGNPNDPGQFNTWEKKSVRIAGTARSVTFSGSDTQLFIDNITLGEADPTGLPTPGTLALTGAALLAMAARRRRA